MKKTSVFSTGSRILIILALLIPFQVMTADPWIRHGIGPPYYYNDVGGEDLDYCNTNYVTLVARDDLSTSHTYQWYKRNFNTQDGNVCLIPMPNNEYAVSGATSNIFVPPSSGRYRCYVTPSSGTPYWTNYVYIYEHEPGIINVTTQINQTDIGICEGDDVSLTFRAEDDLVNCHNQVRYYWQVLQGSSWPSISGANSSTYVFTPDMDGSYRCYATNGCSSVYSNTVEIDFLPNPEITSHPVAENPVCEGITTNFSITTTGFIDQVNWWFKSPSGSWTQIGSQHTVYSGYTSNILTINTPSRSLNNYQYRCIVQNSCGSSAESSAGTLLVMTPPENVHVTLTDAIRCLETPYSNSVTADGTQPFTYQWKLGSVVKSTSASLSIPLVSLSDAGTYKCYLTNTCASNVPSDDAILTVKSAPDITVQPGDQVVCENPLATTQFSLTATGSDREYTWQISENNGTSWETLVNTAVYSINQDELQVHGPAFEMDGNLFRCIVSGYCSPDATSQTAKLTVKDPIEIASESDNNPVCEGSEANFSVQVSGSGPILYQWQKRPAAIADWRNLPGENNSSFQFIADDSLDNHQYRCHIEQDNLCGKTLNSTIISLDVQYLPQVLADPAPKSPCEGQGTTFSVSAEGTSLSYRWQVDDGQGGPWIDLDNTGIYSNVNTPTLNLSNVTPESDRFLYRCRVQGSCSPPAYSASAMLTLRTAPEFITHPESMVKCTGQSATFSAKATGTQPVYYQWRKNGGSVTDLLTDTFYTIPVVGLSDAGVYDVRVSNECSSAVIGSDNATLTVNTPPGITTHPAPVSLCEGALASVSFTTSVTGGSDFLWQVSEDNGTTWSDLVNDAVYSGVSSDELVISDPAAAMDRFQYRCQVIGVCVPPVTTNPALLTVNTPPEILTHPVNDSACTGESMSFSVTAGGTAPLEYRWKKGGKSITDWIAYNSLTLDEVTMDDDQESILCLVRNYCAFNTPVESDEAIIRVWPPPVVSLGADRHLCPGDSILLDPGSGYTSYSWNTGAISRTIAAREAGTYKVTVSDEYGCQNDDNVYIYLDPSIPGVNLGEDRSYCMDEVPQLDAGPGYDSYEWSEGSTGRTIQPASSDTYWVRASSNNSVCIAGDTVHVQIAEPYNQERLCIVTVDLETGKNLLVWEKTHDAGIRYYNLWRETSIGQYEPIARDIPFDDLSIFSDTQVSPENRSYLYKITVTDTCGNESDLDSVPYHKPIFLKFVPSDQGVSLTWTNYEIQGMSNLKDILTSYEIYRGTESAGLSFYTTVGSINDYLDTDPATATTKFFYRVAGVLSTPCEPSAARKSVMEPVTSSMSNLEYNHGVGTEDVVQAALMSIYPNPLHEAATIRFYNPRGENYTLVITDLSGKIVRIARDIHGDEFVLHRNDLGSGFYQVELAGRETFRAKLIIE